MTATAPVTAREDYQAMEFSVTKSALLNELTTTQGVVERKTTIPILSNILVEAKGTRLTITATDLELSIRTSCEVKIKKEGAGTIPAKKLLELVRLLPEGEIKFRLLENHWVEITSDKKKYRYWRKRHARSSSRQSFPGCFSRTRQSQSCAVDQSKRLRQPGKRFFRFCGSQLRGCAGIRRRRFLCSEEHPHHRKNSRP